MADQELDFTGTALEMASVYLAMTTKALSKLKNEKEDDLSVFISVIKTCYLEMINEAKHKITEYVKAKLDMELPCDDSEIYDTRWNTEFTDAISQKLNDIRVEREKKLNASS